LNDNLATKTETRYRQRITMQNFLHNEKK